MYSAKDCGVSHNALQLTQLAPGPVQLGPCVAACIRALVNVVPVIKFCRELGAERRVDEGHHAICE